MATLSKKAREFYAKISHIGVPLKGTRNQNVPYLLAKTMDKIDIWDEVEVPVVVKQFKQLRIFWQPHEEFLGGVIAQYEPFDNAMVFHKKYINNPNEISTFAHETIHALSSCTAISMVGKAQVNEEDFCITPEVAQNIEACDRQGDIKGIKILLENNKRGSFIRNVGVYNEKYQTGFSVAEFENVNGPEQWMPSDAFRHLNEGATNLLAMLVCREEGNEHSFVDSYEFSTKLVAQIYAIVGKKLWVYYFNQNVQGLAKDMGYEIIDFEKLYSKEMEEISSSTWDIEKSVKLQLETLRIFTNRIQNEIMDPNKNFIDVISAQEALFNCFIQYAKLFDTGYYIVPNNETHINRYWMEFEKALIETIGVLNEKLMLENFNPPKKIDIKKVMDLCKQQRGELCFFLPKYCAEINMEKAQIDNNLGKIEEVNKQSRKKQRNEFYKKYSIEDC